MDAQKAIPPFFPHPPFHSLFLKKERPFEPFILFHPISPSHLIAGKSQVNGGEGDLLFF